MGRRRRSVDRRSAWDKMGVFERLLVVLFLGAYLVVGASLIWRGQTTSPPDAPSPRIEYKNHRYNQDKLNQEWHT